MMILRYIRRGGDFDDETTRIMGDAFEVACAEVPEILNDVIREIIALRIIEAARKGERDPEKLRRAGLVTLEPK